jgi:hypothetical protein
VTGVTFSVSSTLVFGSAVPAPAAVTAALAVDLGLPPDAIAVTVGNVPAYVYRNTRLFHCLGAHLSKGDIGV